MAQILANRPDRAIYREKNRERLRAKGREYYANNRDRVRAQQKAIRDRDPDYNRKANLKFFYGLTLEEYHTLLVGQGGVCAICKTLPEDYGLVIDHNHETGAVRALLCRQCNILLGMAKEDISVLQNASNYLAVMNEGC